MQPVSIINGVSCYGDMQDDSNFEVVCDDESFDYCWTDGNPETGKPFDNWSEAVHVLTGIFMSPIVEIHAC